MLRESDYDAAIGCVPFMRAEEVLWSGERSIGWFPFLQGKAKVSSFPAFEWATSKRTVREASRVVEYYAAVRVFSVRDQVRYRSLMSSVNLESGVPKRMHQVTMAITTNRLDWIVSRKDLSCDLRRSLLCRQTSERSHLCFLERFFTWL